MRSVVEGPDAPSNAVVHEHPDVARGTCRLERFRSPLLGNERRVWLYTPAGHGDAGLLLVVLDGWAYLHNVRATTILDNLIADGAIPPVAAVLVDSLDQDTRLRELVCHDPFVSLLADELLPWARGEARRRLPDVLADRGYGVRYAEFAGGARLLLLAGHARRSATRPRAGVAGSAAPRASRRRRSRTTPSPGSRRRGRACACGRLPRSLPGAQRAPLASARSARRS